MTTSSLFKANIYNVIYTYLVFCQTEIEIINYTQYD